MIKKFLNREVVLYIVFGVGTSIVNFVSFFVASNALGIDKNVYSNIISFILATLFAFVTNKIWVFESKKWQPSVVAKEITGFFGSRIFSFFLETFLLWFSVNVIGIGERIGGEREFYLVKIILSFGVVLLNYVFSKVFVFKKEVDK